MLHDRDNAAAMIHGSGKETKMSGLFCLRSRRGCGGNWKRKEVTDSEPVVPEGPTKLVPVLVTKRSAVIDSDGNAETIRP